MKWALFTCCWSFSILRNDYIVTISFSLSVVCQWKLNRLLLNYMLYTWYCTSKHVFYSVTEYFVISSPWVGTVAVAYCTHQWGTIDVKLQRHNFWHSRRFYMIKTKTWGMTWVYNYVIESINYLLQAIKESLCTAKDLHLSQYCIES